MTMISLYIRSKINVVQFQIAKQENWNSLSLELISLSWNQNPWPLHVYFISRNESLHPFFF